MIDFLAKSANKQKVRDEQLTMPVDTSMVSFYSQALNLITNYLKEVGCKGKNSFELLFSYTKKFESFEDARQNSKINLIDNLRFLILSYLENTNKENKKFLRYWHSVLHLMSINNLENLSCFYKINTWLNENFLLLEDDIVLHVTRGNLGNISKIMSKNNAVLEELIKIMSDYRNDLLSDQEYISLRKNWIVKYYKDLPAVLRTIFTTKNLRNSHWTEVLCHHFAYNCNDKSFEKSLKTLSEVIPENDTYYHILTNNQTALIENSQGITKLIFCLFFKPINRTEIYETITNIGKQLFKIDWQVALGYFAFTVYPDYFFNKVVFEFDMNPVMHDFLFRYAIRNGLETNTLSETYAKSLLLNRKYFDCFLFISSKNIELTNMPVDFIDFLIKHVYDFEQYFSAKFINTQLGCFLSMYAKIVKNEMLSDEQITLFMDHKYTKRFISTILKNILQTDRVSELILIRILQLIINKHKDLLFTNEDLVYFKTKLIEKLCSINNVGLCF